MKDETLLSIGLAIALIGAVLWACLLQGCSYIYDRYGIQEDNILEEIVEEVIEYKTGVEVDLSPQDGWNIFEKEF